LQFLPFSSGDETETRKHGWRQGREKLRITDLTQMLPMGLALDLDRLLVPLSAPLALVRWRVVQPPEHRMK
jgi:hypothetical protein